MKEPNYLTTIIKRPNVLKSYRHIFLLSHMRANTSLFGHILGNHQEIEGYYEMHIGYYSWKSLLRQKLFYFSSHKPKANAKYMFDKVLHSEHFVSPELLNRPDNIAIFSLREPLQTVKSIVALYQKVDPNHEFCTIAGAANYFIKRVNDLANMAQSLSGKYIYIDAQCLRDSTAKALEFLTSELALSSPLTSQYQTQNMTGKGDSGDHSENLKLGKIKSGSTDYSTIELNDELATSLLSAYQTARDSLIKHSHKSMCIDK